VPQFATSGFRRLDWALCGILAFSLSQVSAADSSTSHHRSVRKLADGVYLILHPIAPDHFTESNTVVIIGDTAVLVVDSCYLPSSAREDIAQIREWTDKPIRYLLNTHWHNDHTQGNAIYADTFPAINIVANRKAHPDSCSRIPCGVFDPNRTIQAGNCYKKRPWRQAAHPT